MLPISVDNTTGAIIKAATVSFSIGADWLYSNTDGFYYYTKAIKAGESTENLLDSLISSDTATVENAHLEVTVIHQSIQAEPDDAVESAWKVTVYTAQDGTKTISK